MTTKEKSKNGVMNILFMMKEKNPSLCFYGEQDAREFAEWFIDEAFRVCGDKISNEFLNAGMELKNKTQN